MLSAADILKAEDLPVQCVAVPEWGGDVYVATLRADERDELEESWLKIRNADSNEGFRAYCVAFCLCEADGKRLFNDGVLEAARALGKRSAKPVSRLFDVACKLNGLTGNDVKELEKN